MPIHDAASKGHVDVVELLLAASGMHIDILDRGGQSMLSMAIKKHNRLFAWQGRECQRIYKHVKKESNVLAQRLLAAGTRVSSKPWAVGVLLHEAVFASSFDNVCLLLNKGVDIKQGDKYNEAVLHLCNSSWSIYLT